MRWVTLECERVLYVDRGRELILADRLPRHPLTLIVKMDRAPHAGRRARSPVRAAKREIQRAAVCGIDMLWGYADNQDAEQCRQIEIAEHNIRLAILLAARGERMEADVVTLLDANSHYSTVQLAEMQGR